MSPHECAHKIGMIAAQGAADNGKNGIEVAKAYTDAYHAVCASLKQKPPVAE